jgi:prepilin signal peptidase PulO-like enzyme (type II secretory pathway)
MESAEYLGAWSVYLVAGVLFSIISWKFMKKYFWRELSYLLESFLLAIIFTPWYVMPEEEILAPALMVFMLDLITIDATTSIRALIPLVMAILMGLLVTVVLSVMYRVRRRRQLSGIVVDDMDEHPDQV